MTTARQLLELTIYCDWLSISSHYHCSSKDKTKTQFDMEQLGFGLLLGISFIGGSYLPSIQYWELSVLLNLY